MTIRIIRLYLHLHINCFDGSLVFLFSFLLSKSRFLQIFRQVTHYYKNKMTTFFVSQEGPVNALALNRDYSQVAIGGRNGMC